MLPSTCQPEKLPVSKPPLISALAGDAAAITAASPAASPVASAIGLSIPAPPWNAFAHATLNRQFRKGRHAELPPGRLTIRPATDKARAPPARALRPYRPAFPREPRFPGPC